MTTSNFKLERDRLLKEIRIGKPGNETLKKLRKLRLEFDSAIDDYRNSLAILGDTTYEDRKHFLLELIQNADDATYDGEEKFISFSIHEDRLAIAYNENGFTTNDVISITGTGASTKTANKLSASSFIGEKGIGFKSVFALAKEVYIESGAWGFKLHKDNYIVPEVLYPSESFTKGTKLQVIFTQKESVTIVANELQKLVTKQLESFLFLQSLKKFQYQDFRNGPSNPKQLSILPDNDKNTLTLQTFPDELIRTYYVYEEEIEFPGELVAFRWERLGSEHSLKRKAAIVAMNTSKNVSPGLGRLFCYLPTSVKLPIPVFLQIDGHLKADRERLHDIENNHWNHYLLKQLPDFILRTILSWRQNETLSLVLPDFVPDEPGEDQLKKVFESLMYKCQYSPWVKTLEEGWSSPKEVIMAESYWYQWFEEYPELRIETEKVLGKKFLHPDWVSNSRWKTKWRKYRIASLKWNDAIEVFSSVTLPDEFLKNDETLTLIYQYFIKQYGNMGSYERNKLMKALFSARIFPMENDSFKSLISLKYSNSSVYWMSARKKRYSGIEGISNVEIINTEYTYTLQVSSESSEERKKEANIINHRNGQVRQLLRYMGIAELNDNRLLSDLQIPFLLEEKKRWSTDGAALRLQLLYSIFELYQLKSVFDESYLQQLSRLKNALMPNQKGQFKKLYQMILPDNLRLFEEDNLYADAGLDVLYLPDAWFETDFKRENKEERKDVYYRKMRSFFLHCGIANGPKFHFEEKKYNDAQEFKKNEPDLYLRWSIKNNKDFTHNNLLTLRTVSLDSATTQLIKKENISVAIAEGIYKEWSKIYIGNLDRLDTMNYRYEPPPGYVQTIYKRFEDKRFIIKEDNWAGLKYDQIPILTADGRPTNTRKASSIKSAKGLYKAMRYFDLVVEGDTNGYHPFFLRSLQIKSLSIQDVNKKWEECTSENADDLFEATYELSVLELDFSALRLYDKVRKRIRSIHHFKLGKPVSDNTPYIEDQYGVTGKILGQKLRLLVESEVTPLLNILDSFYLKKQSENWMQENMMLLLKQSHELRIDDKSKLIQHIAKLRTENQIEEETLVLFNDQKLYQLLKSVNKFIINLSCDTKELFLLKKAAKEIGFILIEDAGTIQSTGAIVFSKEDEVIFGEMLDLYAQELEKEEAERFYGLIATTGGDSNFRVKIYRTAMLEKSVAGIKIPLPLPYYDVINNQFFVNADDRFDEIAARLLSNFSFTTYRSAIRDFQEIYNKLKLFDIQKEKQHESERSLEGSQAETKEYKKRKNKSESKEHDGAVANENTSTQSLTPRSRTQSENGEKKQRDVNNGERKTDRRSNSSVNDRASVNNKPRSQKGADVNNNDENKRPTDLTIEDVYDQITKQLSNDGQIQYSKEDEEWKLALDPEAGEEIRNTIRDNLQTTLHEGPEFKEIKERKKKKNIRIIDSNSQLPKEFLSNEYGGRCQVCETQLKMANGKNYFDVFRIKEGKDGAWWKDRPFNILGMCPNCNALAKHGGSIDLTPILHEAELLRDQQTFAQEVEAFKGDYYVITITHNGEAKEMVMSSLHMEYFAALIDQLSE